MSDVPLGWIERTVAGGALAINQPVPKTTV